MRLADLGNCGKIQQNHSPRTLLGSVLRKLCESIVRHWNSTRLGRQQLTSRCLGSALALLCLAPSGAGQSLRISVYATAGTVNRYLGTPADRDKAVALLRGLKVTRVFIEGRRGDQYVAPEVADVLISHSQNPMELGEIKTITVLFADIRNFTPLVQEIPLETLRSFLNEFFNGDF